MPLKLSTTIGKIQNLPNSKNIEIVNDFLEYMRNNGSSEHHQNNNLKVVIAFGNFIDKDKSFYDINKLRKIGNSIMIAILSQVVNDLELSRL